VQAKPSFQHEGSLAATSPSWALPFGWFVSLYGAAEVNFVFDSTQSFTPNGVGPNNVTLQRPGSIRRSWGDGYASARRSRFGLSLAGPVTEHVRARFVFETGLFARTEDRPRSRHLYVGIETPIIDLLVGRSYGLFGWGGKGFAPTTAAYDGVFGQIFNLPAQIRLSHIFKGQWLDLEIAAAAVGAPSGVVGPQGEMGLRLAFNKWQGAAAQGVGPAETAPAQLALSALGRRLERGYFAGDPAGRGPPLRAGGLALDLLVPIIPAQGAGLRNALTLTVELSRGTGIADVYPGLDGGFPSFGIATPTGFLAFVAPGPRGTQGVSGDGAHDTIDWRAFVVGLHYHFPLGTGDRLWISAVHSRLDSSNIRALGPLAYPGVWAQGRYYDATVFGRIWRGIHASIGRQLTTQTFADGVEASNTRTMVSLYVLY
jgi:hypothetical protein